MQRVGALASFDTRILAQFPRQRSIASVDSNHIRCAALQHAISESAHIATKVRAAQTRDIQLKFIKCMRKLGSGA
jgi:hypothetical protein